MRYSCFGNSNETDNILYHSAFGRNTKRGKNKMALAERIREWEEAAKIELFENVVARY